MRNLMKTILATLLFPLVAFGTDFYPKPIVLMSNYFSHHVIVAEKSTHKLYLFENDNGLPKLVKTYQMATGKISGDKFYQGDHRTPEGVYLFTEFIPNADLVEKFGKEGEIYGVGAFVMDYPNPLDSKSGKTGGGIWLHSTNDETRIEKGRDSRGCVVAANNDLKDISRYLELNRSAIVVVDQITYLREDQWTTRRDSIQNFVYGWKDNWANENFDQYIGRYHKKKYFDSFRKNYQGFKEYKRAVFSKKGTPKIELAQLTVLEGKNYMRAYFVQNYSSNTINDTGVKTLFLQKDEFYKWKIVFEKWNKIKEENIPAEKFVFRPSDRFFGQNKESI